MVVVVVMQKTYHAVRVKNTKSKVVIFPTLLFVLYSTRREKHSFVILARRMSKSARTAAFTEAARSAHAHRANARRGDASSLVAAVRAAREHSAPVRQVLTKKRPADDEPPAVTAANMFSGARPLTELLAQFRAAGALLNQEEQLVLPAAASSSAAAAAAKPSPPEKHAHPLDPPDLTAHDHRLITAIIAERVLKMSDCVRAAKPTPEAIHHYLVDASHVLSVLCEPYGTFCTCQSALCMGRVLSGGYALMQYVTPRQLARYHATGMIPRAEEQCGMCYLCMLSVLSTAADNCVSPNVGGGGDHQLQVPFFQLVNSPGGYVPEAMHPASARQPSGGVTHPFRRMNAADYVPFERAVWVPAQFVNGEVVSWERRMARGYAELARLHYGSAHRVPAATASALPLEVVAECTAPTCEAVLAAKLLPSRGDGVFATAVGVSVEHLDRVATEQFRLPASPSLVKTLGGRPVAPAEVFATPLAGVPDATVALALALSPLPVARARVLAMVSAAAGDWMSVARRYTLLPTLFRTVTMDAATQIERDYAFLRHLMMYLLFARINALSAEAATAIGATREQLVDYLDSLAPLLDFYRARMSRRLAVEDTVLWDDVAWVDLAPSPLPTYYSAEDLLAAAPPSAAAIRRPSAGSTIAAACKRLPRAASGGVADSYNGAVFERETLAESAASLAPHLAAADGTNAWPYWRPSADLFWVTSLSSSTAVTLPQLLLPREPADNEPEWIEYFARLNAAIDTPEETPATVWRAVVARVNHACAVLAWVTHRLGELDEAVAAAASRVDAWLPADWQTELARRIAALVASRAVITLAALEAELADMPALDVVVEAALVEMHDLQAVAQALKQFLASHVPVVTTFVRARAVLDTEVEPLLARVGACSAAPSPGTLCDETLRCMATRLDSVEFLADSADTSLYAWVMQAVMPTSAHVSDFVARHRQALVASGEYERFACEALYATLTGLYPHARNVATFDAWVRYSWLLVDSDAEARTLALSYYFGELEAPSATGDRVESSERLFFLAFREHFVRTVCFAPAYRLTVLSAYPSYSRFEDNTVYHCENLRTLASDCNFSACNVFALASYVKGAQPWSTYHRPLPRFAAFLAECCRTIDLDLAIEACIRALRPLTADELRPDKELIRAVGSYVERMVAPPPFSAQWLVDLGVSETSARFISTLYREYQAGALNASSGVARLAELAHRAPPDYARISVFFWTLARHTRRHVVPLDADITAKQRRALAEVQHMEGVEHAAQVVLSTVQCCGLMRTFTVQHNANFSGTEPVRLNLDTSAMMCVLRRGKAYAGSRPNDREHNILAMNAAIRAYADYDARLTTDEEREAGRNELKLRRETMRAHLRSYVQTLKDRYTLSCDETEVIFYPAVGFVVEQRDDRGVGGESCTVCPRCGSMTAYSGGMFAANMFTCGACEFDIRRALVDAHEERCAFCSMTKAHAARASHSASGVLDARAHDTTCAVFDDTVVEGVTIARRVWICAMCNSRWLSGAASRFSLSELRYLRANAHLFNASLAELVDPVGAETLIRDVARARADPAVPIPRVGATSEIPRPVSKPKRRMGNHMV
jgi:hypothetical protein